MKYTLEQCLEVQKQVDASINHNGEYMPWLAGIKEVIEMCDHLSMIDTWKKQSEPDMKQAFMELVDVFAFVLSEENRLGGDSKNDTIYNFPCDSQTIILHLIGSLVDSNFYKSISAVEKLAYFLFEQDLESVCYYYMGKKTLTQFRQDNGYKEGTYIKMWGNREDNEFLTDALEKGIEIEEIPAYLKENYERLVIAKSEVE